jgi:hypothetical protein
MREDLKIDEVEAVEVMAEYSDGDRGSILTDKIKLHIKSKENEFYQFILNPPQYIGVIKDLRKIAPGAKYLLKVNNVFAKNKIGKVDENLKIQYNN